MTRMKMVGTDKVIINLKKIEKLLINAAHIAVQKEAIAVMNDSMQNYVPIGTGALMNSASVENIKRTRLESTMQLAYNKEYAAKTHENPRSGKTGGYSPSGKKYNYPWARQGQWKFLEIPVAKEANVFTGNIAKYLKEQFK